VAPRSEPFAGSIPAASTFPALSGDFPEGAGGTIVRVLHGERWANVFAFDDTRGMTGESKPAVDLYWLPLGAGGHSVRLNGRVFEAIAARIDHRDRCDLYHSALLVRVADETFVIEQGPVWQNLPPDRGVVAEGAVGARAAGRFKLFRYEIRCWRNGVLPDIGEAVESPQRLAEDVATAERVLRVIRTVPSPVWGRDELQTGEMWNSNSVTSWLIIRSGMEIDAVRLPPRGRAPGWHAGVVLANRASEAATG
jgi:hypothetical protein